VTVACLILFEPIQIEEDGDTLKVRYYPTIVAGVAAIWLFGDLSVLTYDLGWRHDMPSAAAIAVGLLLIVVGNGLGKFSQNGVPGIRTPWTLADRKVWARTNHVGGWLVVLAGVVTAATGLMGFRMAPGLIALGAAAAMMTPPDSARQTFATGQARSGNRLNDPAFPKAVARCQLLIQAGKEPVQKDS
jgi:uncharacterized membrane protein